MNKEKIDSKISSEYCIGMIVVYNRRDIANILWLKEGSINKSDKVIQVEVWSSRSQKYVKRYLLVNEILNERPIKKRLEKKVR